MRALIPLLVVTATLPGLAADAAAQSIGTLRWQLQPYCNVVTLNVRQDGSVYTLDGFDDQCGAADRAGIVGTAVLNPDGSAGIGLTSSTAPDAAPVALQARLSLTTISGTWTDSAGNSGAFVLTPGPGTGGPPRPVPSNGLRPQSVTADQIAPEAVGSAQIAPGAIEARHLAPGVIAGALGPVTSAQIAAGAITGVHIAAGAVESIHLAGGSVGSAQIAGGAVTMQHFAPGAVGAALGAVTSGQIAPAAIGSPHIAAGAVRSEHLALGAVGSAQIAAGAVGAAQLAAGTVTAAHIAAGAIEASHLAPGLSEALVVGLCPVGKYLRGLAADGAVICEPFFVGNISTTLDLPDFSANDTSVAIGLDGLPVMALRDYSAGALRMLKCGNASCTGGNITTLYAEPGSNAGFAAAIVIRGDGRPIVAHFDATPSALRITSCANPRCTSVDSSTLADDPAAAVGNRPSLALPPDGRPIVAHEDAGAFALRVTKCGNADCTADNVSTTIDNGPADDGYDPTTLVGADGVPMIVHHALLLNLLRVTRCGDEACSSGNVTTTLADDVDAVSSSSAQIGADGLLVISHRSLSGHVLRVTHCGNAACTAGNVTTVADDPGHPVGFASSLVIGGDGLPVISHADHGANALRVTRCGNAACSSGNTSAIADDPADPVGAFSKIALGADGTPIVVHADDPNARLRVTKCGTQSCQ